MKLIIMKNIKLGLNNVKILIFTAKPMTLKDINYIKEKKHENYL